MEYEYEGVGRRNMGQGVQRCRPNWWLFCISAVSSTIWALSHWIVASHKTTCHDLSSYVTKWYKVAGFPSRFQWGQTWQTALCSGTWNTSLAVTSTSNLFWVHCVSYYKLNLDCIWRWKRLQFLHDFSFLLWTKPLPVLRSSDLLWRRREFGAGSVVSNSQICPGRGLVGRGRRTVGLSNDIRTVLSLCPKRLTVWHQVVLRNGKTQQAFLCPGREQNAMIDAVCDMGWLSHGVELPSEAVRQTRMPRHGTKLCSCCCCCCCCCPFNIILFVWRRQLGSGERQAMLLRGAERLAEESVKQAQALSHRARAWAQWRPRHHICEV